MLVTLLLAAGLLALEREEGVFARLVRGLVSRTTLLTEKIVLAAAAAFVVTLIQLAVIRIFVGARDCEPLALAAGALAFAALGTALGALAREVRVASLLAILLALPLAFLALVPVRRGQRRASTTRSTSSPARSRSSRRCGRSTGRRSPSSTCSALAAAYGAISRLALRRF